MKKLYKEEYKELKELPNEYIHDVYIIPSEEYDGFWGKNGYRSFDFVVGSKGDIFGWFHWEGDVIEIMNNKIFGLNIDSDVESGYLRLYSCFKITISNLEVSSCRIEVSDEK